MENIQKQLQEQKIDGWLVYDFHKINPLAWDFLKIPDGEHITRRFFYWIPAEGEPVKILHAIETHLLSHLPGKTRSYVRFEELGAALNEILDGAQNIAMEYSSENRLPYVSRVDAGTVEMVENCGVSVVSSAPLLQVFTSTLTDEQMESQRQASKMAETIAAATWDTIREGISEYDVQQFILGEIAKCGGETDWEPICAFGAHSANPHYSPSKESSAHLKKGDIVLIDFGFKLGPHAIYTDITRMGVLGPPTERQKEVFSIVRHAQKEALALIKKGSVKGFEVDALARKIITEAGFGSYFIHRLGHNITWEPHGSGAHLDSYETHDDRPLIKRTCFSIEPGIYLPGEFGVRLEHDVIINERGEVEVTGGFQDEIHLINV